MIPSKTVLLRSGQTCGAADRRRDFYPGAGVRDPRAPNRGPSPGALQGTAPSGRSPTPTPMPPGAPRAPCAPRAPRALAQGPLCAVSRGERPAGHLGPGRRGLRTHPLCGRPRRGPTLAAACLFQTQTQKPARGARSAAFFLVRQDAATVFSFCPLRSISLATLRLLRQHRLTPSVPFIKTLFRANNSLAGPAAREAFQSGSREGLSPENGPRRRAQEERCPRGPAASASRQAAVRSPAVAPALWVDRLTEQEGSCRGCSDVPSPDPMSLL